MLLREHMTFDQAQMVCEAADDPITGGKSLYMQGIFIQGDVKNLNERNYPTAEIARAVQEVNKVIARGNSVFGECDHPENLTINLANVSHIIEKMWMDGNSGMGKLKVVPTPAGQIIRTLIESGGKLGISSRGSGNVSHNGMVDGFEIITCDIVARPSCEKAMPVPVYEAFNMKRGSIIHDLATAVRHDHSAQKFLTEEMQRFIQSLG